MHAIINKAEKIISNSFHNEPKVVEIIKLLMLEVYRTAVEEKFNYDVENPINIQILLRKVAKFLRVIGRPDLAQFIHKKTREIYKYQ